MLFALFDSSLVVAGQFFCSGTCSNVNCAVAAQVNQVYPPTLALSTPAFNLVGSQQVIYVLYGTTLGLSLLPCSSIGKVQKVPSMLWWCCTESPCCTACLCTSIRSVHSALTEICYLLSLTPFAVALLRLPRNLSGLFAPYSCPRHAFP